MSTQFNERQLRAIELRASGVSFGDVAKAVGVSKTKVQMWFRDKRFADALLARKVAIAEGKAPPTITASDAIPRGTIRNSLLDVPLTANKLEDLEPLSVQYMEMVLRTAIDQGKTNPTAFKIAQESLKRVGKIGAIAIPPEHPIDVFSFEIIEAKR